MDMTMLVDQISERLEPWKIECIAKVITATVGAKRRRGVGGSVN